VAAGATHTAFKTAPDGILSEAAPRKTLSLSHHDVVTAILVLRQTSSSDVDGETTTRAAATTASRLVFSLHLLCSRSRRRWRSRRIRSAYRASRRRR
jgi:hypothetical protein